MVIVGNHRFSIRSFFKNYQKSQKKLNIIVLVCGFLGCCSRGVPREYLRATPERPDSYQPPRQSVAHTLKPLKAVEDFRRPLEGAEEPLKFIEAAPTGDQSHAEKTSEGCGLGSPLLRAAGLTPPSRPKMCISQPNPWCISLVPPRILGTFPGATRSPQTIPPTTPPEPPPQDG